MANKLETDIVLNLQGNLAAKARQYSNQMATLGTRSQRAFAMMEQSAKAASQGIDTWGNRTVIGAGAVAFAFERTFVKTAAEFERYHVMLNKLQGSEQGGAEALRWIEDFTQNTPFALNEVTQSFVRLKALGLDPMDGTMQAIADQAAMMGGTAETVDGIALALGQAWTKGKLQGEEAMQLLERGVPVWDYLVQASKDLGKNNGIGYTAEELQELAKKGLLGREAISDLIKVMGQMSTGAAKEQMNTWNGMVSNMGDHWKIFQKDVMESGAFDVLKDQLGEFLSMLDEMKETGEYDEFVETIGKDLVNGFKAAAEAAREIKEAGQEIIPVVKSIGSMAGAMVDMVGGYGNLAKIMASIYAINKMIRISSPLLQAGGAAGGFVVDKLSKGKGKAGAVGQAASAMGATPVWVVNMPGGGFAGDVVPEGSGKGKGGKSSKFSKGKLGAAGALGALGLLFAAKEYDPTSPMFPSVDFSGGEPKAPPQDPATKQAMDRFNQAYKRDTSSPWAMAGQAPQGNIHLQVDVSDDRVKVTPKYVPPGFSVDPDTGAN